MSGAVVGAVVGAVAAPALGVGLAAGAIGGAVVGGMAGGGMSGLMGGMPTPGYPGTMPTAGNSAGAMDAASMEQQQAMLRGRTSTMLTGGGGVSDMGKTTSNQLLGS